MFTFNAKARIAELKADFDAGLDELAGWIAELEDRIEQLETTRPGSPLGVRQCEYERCRRSFLPKSYRARYCRPACRVAAHRERHREPGEIQEESVALAKSNG